MKSIGVENTILDDESPDPAALNSNLIVGVNNYLFNSTYYPDEVVGPLVNRKIP